ncbi:hypothetical protein DL96DRAFT_1011456 [Flagelloscypha sp. PMI_526]|nr:hypothetical protein DL96DRAFT_1011456 [Flagelloscypha sp. PMI_526]
MSNTVILDDRAAQIIYSTAPPWTDAGTFPDWHQTSRQPKSEGASFEMTFQGTSVEVLGVLHSPGTDGGFPNIPVISSFSVDGGAVTNFTGPSTLAKPTFFNSFFAASNLDATKNHTLKWTQANNGSIFLDAIIYDASSAFTPQQDTNYVVDQGDSRVQYAGSWTDLNSDQVFKGGLKFGRKTGDNISFKFNGSAIAMYGKLDPLGAANTEGQIPTASTFVTYTVDSITPIKASYPIPTSAVYGDQLFLFNNLASNQEHTFTMKLENDQPIYVDYFIVSPVGKELPSKSDLFKTAQQNAISNGSGSGTSTSPTSSSSAGAGSSKFNIGAIVGGVVGGLAIIALSVLFFLLHRRKRKARDDNQNSIAAPLPFSEIPQPFIQTQPSTIPTSLSRSTVKEMYTPPSSQRRSGAGTSSSAFSGTRGTGSSSHDPPPYDVSMSEAASQPSRNSRVLKPNR